VSKTPPSEPKPGIFARAAIVILGVLTLVAAPPTASAQSGKKVYRVGVLHPAFFRIVPPVEGLMAGLEAAGMEEGRDVVYDIHFTRGKSEALTTEAAALLRGAPDVILTFGEEATLAAKKATTSIPIVFTDVGDPVATGIVAAVSRPGGNVTGVSGMLTELVPKRLEILKLLVPTARRVWMVYHREDLSSLAAARRAAEVAPRFKLELVDRAVRTQDELVAQLRGLKPGDALFTPQALTLNIPGIVLDLQLVNRVPAVFANPFWVEAGGLVSYGADVKAQGVQAARQVEKILKGAKPADLPVEGANKVELSINLKAARSLGITVPNDLLLRAERVID
jgi:putative ABC transport system substrate-binding protein